MFIFKLPKPNIIILVWKAMTWNISILIQRKSKIWFHWKNVKHWLELWGNMLSLCISSPVYTGSIPSCGWTVTFLLILVLAFYIYKAIWSIHQSIARGKDNKRLFSFEIVHAWHISEVRTSFYNFLLIHV